MSSLHLVNGHNRPRGHSNCYPEETVVYEWRDGKDSGVIPDVASVPLIGGSAPGSCKALPPLALTRAEWEEIGLCMGWIKRKRKTHGKRGSWA